MHQVLHLNIEQRIKATHKESSDIFRTYYFVVKLYTCMIYVKKNVTFVHRNLIKTTHHTFMVSSEFVREAPDTELRCFLPNALRFLPNVLQFRKRAAIRGMRHIFTAKPPAIFEALQSTVTEPSKCGTHGGRKAAHMAPRFQVLPRRVCCILFYQYI